jgi:hypothetical protein
MQVSGTIRKMRVAAQPSFEAQYNLPIGDSDIAMNTLIGEKISVAFKGDIFCVNCATKTKTSFNQGYCYRCLTTLAQCDSCIIKPELCHYEAGTCREPIWGETNCLQDHFVYLANTGTVKVGITRHVNSGISSRWLDQGASQAMAILRVQNRLISGLVESAMKAHIADKTNWRTMLKAQPDKVDLLVFKQTLLSKVEAELDDIQQEYGFQAINFIEQAGVDICYPVKHYPQKIKSINLDKELGFSGKLQGIKGQYLMLDGDRVINLRKYSGYELTLNY